MSRINASGCTDNDKISISNFMVWRSSFFLYSVPVFTLALLSLMFLSTSCSNSVPDRQIMQLKPSVLSSGTDRTIENFQSADLVLKPGEEHEFTFRAREGEYLNVEPVPTPSDLDLHVRLYTYQGKNFDKFGEGTLIEADIGGQGVYPRFKDIRLDKGTNYKLIIDSSGKVEGAYSLTFYITDYPMHQATNASGFLIFIVVILALILVGILVFVLWKQYFSGSPIFESARHNPSSGGDMVATSGAPEDLREEIAKVIRSHDEIQIVRRQKENADAQISMYRNGYDAYRLKKGFLEIIQAFENADRALDSADSAGWMEVVHLHIEQFLEDVGVESFAPEIGSPFREAENTKSVKTIPTADSSLSGTIAEVNTPGYWTSFPELSAEKYVIREANVSIYVVE